jgi:hypothetical protein
MAERTLERRSPTASPWTPSGRVHGQRGGATQSRGAATTRADVVEAARRIAFARTVTARLKTIGVTAPGPPRTFDSSVEARLVSRNLARRMFAWDNPNMDQVAEILSTMITHLSPRMRWDANPQDQTCARRGFNAYVVGNRPPIHLCPAFFRSTPEERARTLVHEAAHAAGIGEVDSETYCPVVDCESGCGGFETADSWSHYVYCLSTGRSDQPETVTSGTRTPRSRPTTRSR